MRYLAPIFFLFLFFSCEQNDGVTPSNYGYKFHIDEEGATPQVGDQVVFHEIVLLNGEEIFSTEEFGKKEIILPPEDILTRPLPPNYEVLFKMSVGDSVTVTQKLKGLKSLPEGYDGDDVMKYVIKLLEITPKSKLEAAKKKGKTTSNYPFEIYKKTGNILAQQGDRIRFEEYRYINDSLVYATPTDKPAQAFLPARNKVPTPPPGNYEALLLGGIGDSIYLSQLLVDVKDLPKNLSPNDTFNYRVKIIEVLTPGEYEILKIAKVAQAEQVKKEAKASMKTVFADTKSWIKKLEAGELENDLTYTRSGLKYMIHEKGKGKLPNPTEEVRVHFAGFLMDGTLFDTSLKDGEPLEFPLGMGRVIKGWDEGIAKLPIGSKATFFIPYKMAYGFAGRPPKIPQLADLVFYIEVLEES